MFQILSLFKEARYFSVEYECGWVVDQETASIDDFMRNEDEGIGYRLKKTKGLDMIPADEMKILLDEDWLMTDDDFIYSSTQKMVCRYSHHRSVFSVNGYIYMLITKPEGFTSSVKISGKYASDDDHYIQTKSVLLQFSVKLNEEKEYETSYSEAKLINVAKGAKTGKLIPKMMFKA